MLSADLYWYMPWLSNQIAQLPQWVLGLLWTEETITSIDLSVDSAFYRVFMSINRFTRREGSNCSIDDIIECLRADSLLESIAVPSQTFQAQRCLVFAILGWQSMLYSPSFNTCPLSELAIQQAVDQPDSRLVFDTFKVSTDLADRPLAILMKAFGNLLPSRPQTLTKIASETSRVASLWYPINPLEVNAHFLHSLLRVRFRWVDSLALHLDYDRSTRTLSLFRYPSVCIHMLLSQGAVYSFASAELHSSDPRADHDEITDILTESLLSYRLLFGQSKSSRRFFRQLLRSEPILTDNADIFLNSICAKKLFAHQLVPRDRWTYFAPRDFPVLGERLETLAKEMKGARPKSWKDLLRDRRDTTQYWTFWLVAIFGVASILLSFTQVLLTSIQIARS